jgi:hypothetical protein
MNWETLSKNRWGSVNPYTRHLKGCEHPELNSCSCPKWLYENKKGEKPRRSALNTNSWAEANEIASDKLGGDPEIAQALEANQKMRRVKKTVHTG